MDYAKIVNQTKMYITVNFTVLTLFAIKNRSFQEVNVLIVGYTLFQILQKVTVLNHHVLILK